MPEVFVVDGVRSPIGSLGGSLSSVRADDLAAHVITRLLAKFPALPAARIEDVILGCANQAGEDNRNVARMAALLAGLPASVPGETVNRLCASGLCASINLGRAIRCGEISLGLSGGVESMTRAPYVLSKSSSAFARNQEIFDSSIGWRFINPKMRELYGTDSMGETAENVAAQLKISRSDQDQFALRSQQKAAQARESGRLAMEICPLEINLGKGKSSTFAQDEFIRADSTLEALAKLKPAFREGGTVTAGNSSGINDGACAVLMSNEAALKEFKLEPKLRYVAAAVSGIEPKVMGLGPVQAIRKVLKLAGLKLEQIDLIELNEAFAAQSLGCLRELGIEDADQRVNPNGGAIALGHPLGMSGARLVLSAAYQLQQSKARYALCSMCVGVGQGVAAVFERV